MNKKLGNKNAVKDDCEKKDSNLNIRCKRDDLATWKDKATSVGLTLSEWVLSKLNN